jgi:hypothetical protein
VLDGKGCAIVDGASMRSEAGSCAIDFKNSSYRIMRIDNRCLSLPIGVAAFSTLAHSIESIVIPMTGAS